MSQRSYRHRTCVSLSSILCYVLMYFSLLLLLCCHLSPVDSTKYRSWGIYFHCLSIFVWCWCMVLQNRGIAFLLQDPFYPVQISHLPPPKHPQTITLGVLWQMASSTPPASLNFFCISRLSIFVIRTPQTYICLFIKKNSNLPLSSVCVLLPILIFSFYWPVWDMAFSLQLCLFLCNSATLPRRPASWSHLFTVDVETGVLRVLFNEAASKDLWSVCFSN